MKKLFRNILAASAIIALIGTTACQSDNDAKTNEENNTQELNNEENNTQELKEDFKFEKGNNVLNISYCWDFYYLEESIERFKEKFPDAQINVTKYNNDEEKYIEQMATKLMAGNADDLMDSYGIEANKYAESGLLADFKPALDSDPTFNNDTYYMNVFEGKVENEKLYEFPTNFEYNKIGVNNKFSEKLVEEFAKYDTVSYMDLFNIYESMDNHEGYYLYGNFDVSNLIFENLDMFIDFNNKTCDFNKPEFLDMMNKAKAVTDPNKMEGYVSSNMTSVEEEDENSKKFFFKDISTDNYQYFLPYKEYGYFVDFKPKTDVNGKAEMVNLKSFVMNQNANDKALAWEFLKFMNTKEATDGLYQSGMPINRKDCQEYLTREMENNVAYLKEGGFHLEGNENEAISNAVKYIEAMNETPFKSQSFYQEIYEIAINDIKQFADGTMTAEQVASNLQNKISILLTE